MPEKVYAAILPVLEIHTLNALVVLEIIFRVMDTACFTLLFLKGHRVYEFLDLEVVGCYIKRLASLDI